MLAKLTVGDSMSAGNPLTNALFESYKDHGEQMVLSRTCVSGHEREFWTVKNTIINVGVEFENVTSNAIIDIEVIQHPLAKAYYFCGLSDGFAWKYNTHVAFVPDSGKEVRIDNDRIFLTITNARRIHFWDYTPNPPGEFTKSQRTCRNWIFANYLKDGMPL